jgi:negative regulator of sigma E activity
MDDLHESLSALADGLLERDAARGVIARASDDAEARDRWTRYALIGDALRGNATPDDGFSPRVLERLRGARREPGFDPLGE